MAYTITGRKSGSVRFEPDTIGNIQSEAVSMSSKVTSNPIENGADINDHVVKDPVKFSISGTIIGGQQGQQNPIGFGKRFHDALSAPIVDVLAWSVFSRGSGGR